MYTVGKIVTDIFFQQTDYFAHVEVKIHGFIIYVGSRIEIESF